MKYLTLEKALEAWQQLQPLTEDNRNRLSRRFTVDFSHEIKKCLLLGRKVMTNLDSIFKSRDITLPTKVRLVKAIVFCSHVWMWQLNCKESWALKNWCFWTVVLEKTLERPLDSKEIKPANPKGNQPWIFIGRTDAEAPIFWPPDAKSPLFGKDPDAGKDWGQEGKGVIEDEMIGWHHRLNGHEFEQALGDGEGQGRLVCCSPWVAKCWTWLNDWTTRTKQALYC